MKFEKIYGNTAIEELEVDVIIKQVINVVTREKYQFEKIYFYFEDYSSTGGKMAIVYYNYKHKPHKNLLGTYIKNNFGNKDLHKHIAQNWINIIQKNGWNK